MIVATKPVLLEGGATRSDQGTSEYFVVPMDKTFEERLADVLELEACFPREISLDGTLGRTNLHKEKIINCLRQRPHRALKWSVL